MGRVIPAPHCFRCFCHLGVNTDYSGCSGPLPIVAAAIWNSTWSEWRNLPSKVLLRNDSRDHAAAHVPSRESACNSRSVAIGGFTWSSTWTFLYATDGSGDLAQVTLPGGGTLA